MAPRAIGATLTAALLLSHAGLALQDSARTAPPPFRVSVDAVRIDAVVTDRDGRMVTDLTAKDFEVFQNGKPQKVTFAQFVPVAFTPRASITTPASRGPASVAVPVPAPAVAPVRTRAEIQRTLVVVVDDLGLSVESLFSVKKALHEFIDRDVQAADLVGILRTGGTSSVQPFTTDRRVLHSAIDGLRWNGFSRSGVEPFESINKWTTFDERSGLGDLTDFAVVNRFRSSMSASGTLGALNLAVRAARDLPGRKFLLLVSEGFQLRDPEEKIDSRVRAALDRLLDQATRAGVVIYSLDARGLQTGGLQASDNLKSNDTGRTMDETVRGEAAARLTFNRDTQEALAYVAEQTGGFAILNTNDLGAGLGRISAAVRDYYVIGYVPDEGTFVGEGKKPSYHRISVKVRRPGLRVRTRKQFLGVSDIDEVAQPQTPAHELLHAALSPFAATEMPLQATTLPGYSTDRGLFVRTLLHIDARALTFVEGEGDKKTASADVLGMVFDRDGTQVAHLSTGFSVGLTEQATEEALRAGLVYTLLVPILRAGAYQMRLAVRDRESGKLGNTGEFVELPDVTRGVFALSGILLRGDESGAADQSAAGTIAISPTHAFRRYRRGIELSYAYDIYNASEKVRAAASIWRGAQNIATLPADLLMRPTAGEQRFSAKGRLKLAESLPPGSYMLQVAATTTPAGDDRRARTAVQRIHFELE